MIVSLLLSGFSRILHGGGGGGGGGGQFCPLHFFPVYSVNK